MVVMPLDREGGQTRLNSSAGAAVCTTSDLRNQQAEFHQMLHDDSLGPGNDAHVFEILKYFNLGDF